MFVKSLRNLSLKDREKMSCIHWTIILLVLITTFYILTLNYHENYFWVKKGQMTTQEEELESEQTEQEGSRQAGEEYQKPEDFEGFNNVTGRKDGCYIVPNYIHFVRLWQSEFKFYEAVTALAAFKNQRPERIYFHTNEPEFRGKYWEILINTPGFKDVVHINQVDPPTEIFGRKLSEGWLKHHSGDIVRLMVLMQFGGVFLDNDSYVVRSIDDLRRFELAIAWMEDANLGNQVIVAHKNARFLRLWLDTYHKYDKTCWYCNAGVIPTQDVLIHKPYLVHRMKDLLASHGNIIGKVFLQNWGEWRNHYVLHLLINHQYLLKNISDVAYYPVEFNETNIKNYPVTFKEMVYDVYPMEDEEQ